MCQLNYWLLSAVEGPGCTEAVATVHRLVASRSEGHHRVLATLSANCWVHFAGPSSEASFLALTRPTTLGAALGLIGVTFRGEELLLSSGKGKFIPAIYAGKGLI